ncbi:MAG TPA: ABC transporter permease subunit [Candidatus Methylacidiphilales bacterium]
MLRRLIHDPRLSRWTPWFVPAVLVIIWQLAAHFGLLPVRILPAPTSVIQSGVDLAKTGELFEHLLISSRRAALGFLIGGSIGFTLGLLNGVFRTSELLFDGSLQMLRNLPLLALIPMVIAWFGIGEEAKVFIISLAVFFPIYLNTFYGIRSIDPDIIEMARVYRLSTYELFRDIILPGALPTILLGVRYALNFMWLTLIVAETISATSGIGYLAMNAREFMQTDVIVLTILIYAVLGKLSDSLARLLESLLLPWHHSQQAAKKQQLLYGFSGS